VDYSNYTSAISKGDREMFRAYMDMTIDAIFRLVCRVVASDDDANDIVQETYIRVWEKRKSIKEEKSIFAWTKRIAINKCYDFLRAEKRKERWNKGGDVNELINLESSSNAEENINGEEYGKILDFLTSKLSAKQKMIFTLSAIEKLSADEIMEITGMSKSSIKSNLHHARTAVKKNAGRIL
jgi:RNA polymerase sigma-70 factor (ECF subfamily)